MEDLIPLLIFIAIAAINFLKYVSEKSGRKPPAKPQGAPRGEGSRTLEDFFEEIERKFQPQPRELPAWPETIERPDYVREMEAFEEAKASTAPEARTGRPVREFADMMEEPMQPAPSKITPPTPRSLGKAATFRIPAQGAVFSGLNHMRISMPPLLRSAAGHTEFELRTRPQLRQGLIASMVFGQPRAYDTTFYNTLAK